MIAEITKLASRKTDEARTRAKVQVERWKSAIDAIKLAEQQSHLSLHDPAISLPGIKYEPYITSESALEKADYFTTLQVNERLAKASEALFNHAKTVLEDAEEEAQSDLAAAIAQVGRWGTWGSNKNSKTEDLFLLMLVVGGIAGLIISWCVIRAMLSWWGIFIFMAALVPAAAIAVITAAATTIIQDKAWRDQGRTQACAEAQKAQAKLPPIQAARQTIYAASGTSPRVYNAQDAALVSALHGPTKSASPGLIATLVVSSIILFGYLLLIDGCRTHSSPPPPPVVISPNVRPGAIPTVLDGVIEGPNGLRITGYVAPTYGISQTDCSGTMRLTLVATPVQHAEFLNRPGIVSVRGTYLPGTSKLTLKGYATNDQSIIGHPDNYSFDLSISADGTTFSGPWQGNPTTFKGHVLDALPPMAVRLSTSQSGIGGETSEISPAVASPVSDTQRLSHTSMIPRSPNPPVQTQAPILFQRIAEPGKWCEPIVAPTDERQGVLTWTNGRPIRVSINGQEYAGTDKINVPAGAEIRFRSKGDMPVAVAWKAYFRTLSDEESKEILPLPELPRKPVFFQRIAEPNRWSDPITMPAGYCQWMATRTPGRDLLISVDGRSYHATEKIDIPAGSAVQFRSADRRAIAVAFKVYFWEPSQNELNRTLPLPHIPGEF